MCVCVCSVPQHERPFPSQNGSSNLRTHALKYAWRLVPSSRRSMASRTLASWQVASDFFVLNTRYTPAELEGGSF